MVGVTVHLYNDINIAKVIINELEKTNKQLARRIKRTNRKKIEKEFNC